METRICEHCDTKMTAIKTDKKVTIEGCSVKSVETYMLKCPKCKATVGPIQKIISKEEN